LVPRLTTTKGQRISAASDAHDSPWSLVMGGFLSHAILPPRTNSALPV